MKKEYDLSDLGAEHVNEDLSDLGAEPIHQESPEAISSPSSPEKYSELESIGYGASNNVPLFPQLQAGVRAVVPEQDSSYIDRYRQLRDQFLANKEGSKREDPGGYYTGMIGGAFFPGMAVAKGISSAAKIGAGVSALTGLENSSVDLTRLKDGDLPLLTKDIVKSAAIGGTLGGVLGKFSSLLDAKKAKSAAEKLAAAAISERPSFLTKERSIAEGTKALGRTALDEGLLNIVGGGSEKVLEKTKTAMDLNRKTIEPILQEVQNQVGDVSGKIGESLTEKFANIRDQLLEKYKGHTDFDKIKKGIDNTLFNYLDNNPQLAKGIQELNKTKSSLGSQLSETDWSKTSDLPYQKDLISKMYGALKSEVEDVAEMAGKGTGDKVKELNSRFSNLLDIKNITKKEAATDAGKAMKFTGGDIALGALGTMEPMTFGVLAAKKGLEKVSNQTVPEVARIATARGLDAASNVMEKIPNLTERYKRVAGVASGNISGPITGLFSNNDKLEIPEEHKAQLQQELSSKGSQTLSNELQNFNELTQQQRAAKLFKLYQNKDFRDATKNVNGEGDER